MSSGFRDISLTLITFLSDFHFGASNPAFHFFWFVVSFSLRLQRYPHAFIFHLYRASHLQYHLYFIHLSVINLRCSLLRNHRFLLHFHFSLSSSFPVRQSKHSRIAILARYQSYNPAIIVGRGSILYILA
ncbi:hypothetical protein L218DRAFT_436051 [Marasmius fiardii PR-910]|nr:hypothetical protein L218DRAFT_436051 [Marasmius fiardii PR-910]